MESNRDMPGDPAMPSSRTAELIVENGRLSGTRRPLSACLNLIGRAVGCDVRLNVKGVAPQHCVVVQGAEGLMVRDLGGPAGTLVNGDTIAQAKLSDGDVLTVGPFRFRVAVPPPSGPPMPGEEREALEKERQALRIQAAAVAAQQVSVTEDESRIEQRRSALERQEQQLARHLEERRNRLLELREEVRSHREGLKQERITLEEQQKKSLEELDQSRREVAEESEQLERQRKQILSLRDRLQRRYDRNLKEERASIRQREAAAQAERQHLAKEVERLDHARTTLEKARLEVNGELELGRRALQDGWQQLHLERKQAQERLAQDQAELHQQAKGIRQREEALIALEAELTEQQRHWVEHRERLEQEAEGLDSRIRNYRRKVYELEQDLERLARQRQQTNPQDIPAPSPIATPSDTIPAVPQSPTTQTCPRIVAQEDRGTSGELAAVETLVAELADQRLHLVEQCERFLSIQNHWRQEQQEIAHHLEDVQRQFHQREQALTAREHGASAGDQVIDRHRADMEQSRLRLEGMLTRQAVRDVTFQAERERLLNEVRTREEILGRHQGFLLALRDRWAERRRGDMRQVRSELELTRTLRQRYTKLWQECHRRRVALEQEQRTSAEQALALEQLRLVLLGQSEDSAAADRRLEKMRRRCRELTASAERTLARERQAIEAEAARLKELAERVHSQTVELTEREEELSDRQADWEKEQALTELGRLRLQHELNCVKGQREHFERQAVNLNDELERVARMLIDGDEAPPLLVTRAA